MSDANRKVIVLLSPEPWGKMMLSKMHYAMELVKKGNKVFFVNPPRQLEGKGLAVLAEEREGGDLVIIDTNIIPGSLFLRHKLFFLYSLLNRRYIKAIKKITGTDIYQVWSFNPNVYTDLRSFRAEKSILLLYDLYGGKHVWKAAGTADALVSVSQVILDHYGKTPPPKLLVQHGLGRSFADKALERRRQGPPDGVKEKIRVGYTGNLLREGMNTEIARDIIRQHPDIEFHFWGPSSLKDNNVNAANMDIKPELASFIGFLEQEKNVFLHGVVEQKELAENLFEMDVFLFLYSPRKEVNGASNAHKLLEYISTGKTVVSTFVSNYAGTGLLVMSDSENDLPAVFDTVIRNLPAYNSPEKQKERMDFALDNVYPRQVERILNFVR